MEQYRLTEQERAFYEGLKQPFAVYQFVDNRVATLAVSEGFCALFGFADPEEAIRETKDNPYPAVHPNDVSRVTGVAGRFIHGGENYDVLFRARTGESLSWRLIHARGDRVVKENGACLGLVWYLDEGPYTEEATLADTLQEDSVLNASHYDSLTGLPNLTWFFQLAKSAKDQVTRGGNEGALLYMDLNGMKFYNHRNGFTEGDRLLKSFTRILVDLFTRDCCTHVTADRFAAYTRKEGLEKKLQRLFNETAQINEGNSLPVRVGIYTTGMGDIPVTMAFDRAKLACDRVRKTDISGFRYYSDQFSKVITFHQYVVENIDKAIANRWIQVYYQPIIRTVNNRVCDEEALARWIDPQKGLISPMDFIPRLESAGMAYKLDLYVLGQVLEKMKRQQEAGLYLVPQSINLSRSDFDVCDIVEEIRARVDEAGIPRNQIAVEITESIIGRDVDFMKKQVERFRALGFPVWMDDFGSAYSSLDVLQDIRFDLIKFDMSFLRKLDESKSSKIILTELMKMATSLGLDTICEGVETEEQMHFLQEIGCSKLQGYYFCQPIPFSGILERYRKGRQIGFEDPAESAYFETIGRVNLYDLAVLSGGSDFRNAFNTLPIGIMELKGGKARFLRTNPSYRAFLRRFFGFEIAPAGNSFSKFSAPFMRNLENACREPGSRTFYDERMPDGTIVHSYARGISVNPVAGTLAVAVAVLSVSDPDEGATYVDIARALAADYYNIYVVDLDTEDYIEYTSPVGRDELAIERHGPDFFASARRDTMTRIYPDDREFFLTWFTKENIVKELDEQGVFTTSYRLIDTGSPVFVNMKVNRMQGSNRIILGVSVVDSQMRQQEQAESAIRERDALARVMALTEDYITLYSVHPDTGRFIEYAASPEYRSLGIETEGDDFFGTGAKNAASLVYPEDLPGYLKKFTKKHVLKDIADTGICKIHYRLMIAGRPRNATLKFTPFRDGDEQILLAGIRLWRMRKS